MDADEPALFDLPPEKRPTASQRRQRGRNRETWTRTVTAEITIVDAEALQAAARRAEETAVTIGPFAEPDEGDIVGEGPAVQAAPDAFDALTSLLWPTDGMEGPLAADALRILSMEIEVEPESEDRGSLAWTVTVTLTDVHELRRLAAEANTKEAGLIADSLAAAWQFAADPYAPLRSIPGIAWRPGGVEVRPVAQTARPGTLTSRDVGPLLTWSSRDSTEEFVDLVLVRLEDLDLADLPAGHAVQVHAPKFERLLVASGGLAEQERHPLLRDQTVEHLDLDRETVRAREQALDGGDHRLPASVRPREGTPTGQVHHDVVAIERERGLRVATAPRGGVLAHHGVRVHADNAIALAVGHDCVPVNWCT